MKVHSGNITGFSTPENAIPLTYDKSIVCDEVEVFVDAANKANMYIGGPSTSSTDNYEKGWRLEPGDVWMVPVGDNNTILLSDIYVAAKNSGDRLSFGYTTGKTRQSLPLDSPDFTPR